MWAIARYDLGLSFEEFEELTPGMFQALCILSIWCMAIIAWAIHHMMNLDDGKLQAWISGLPFIIAALTGFAAWPYAISKGGSSLSDVAAAFRKRNDSQ